MWTLAVEEQFYVLWPSRSSSSLCLSLASSSGSRCRRSDVRCSRLCVEALYAVGRRGNVRSGVHGHRLAYVRPDGRRPARHRAHARPAPRSVPLAEHRAHGRGVPRSSFGRCSRWGRRTGRARRTRGEARCYSPWVRRRSSGPCRPGPRGSPRFSRWLPSRTSAVSRTASTSGTGRSSSGRMRGGST